MGGSSSKSAKSRKGSASAGSDTKTERSGSNVKAFAASLKAESAAAQKADSKGKKAGKQDKKGSVKGDAEKDKADKAEAEKKLAKKGPKSVQSRMALKTSVVLTEEEQAEKAKAAKLFQAPKGPERSKIFQALNPTKLYYESRREKEEAKGETNQIRIRGSAGDDFGFGVLRDEDGNIMEEEESEGEYEEEEEDYDPDNLPDFGPYQKEMEELRKKRAKALEEKQEVLRRRHTERKEKEEAALKLELAKIQAKEDELKKQQDIHGDDFVEKTQERLAKETKSHLEQFKFESS